MTSVRLADVITFTKGKKPKRLMNAHQDGLLPYILIESFEGMQSLFTDDKYCPVAESSDTLVVCDGARTGLSSSGLFGCIGSTLAALKSNSSRLDPGYLFYFIKSSYAFLNSRTKGAAIPHLDKELLLDLPLLLPSVQEQRSIVDLLSRAEAIVSLRREAEKKVAELIPALFLDMFGEPATNPKGWPVSPLEDLLASGPQNGLYKHSSLYGKGTPILRIDAFYDGRVKDLGTLKRVEITPDERDKFRLAPRDIVINRVNSVEYLAKSAIIPALLEDTVFESNMMRLSVDETQVLPEYLIELLQTSYSKTHFLAKAKHAINQSSVNQQDVKSLRITIPPLAKQREFAERSEQVLSIQAQQSAASAKAQASFNALLSQTFGK